LMIESAAHKEGVDLMQLAKVNPVEGFKFLARQNYKAMDFVSNFYRSISFLDAADRALKKGDHVSASDAAEAGAEAAGKVLSNLDSHTPLEQSLLARIFPFYAWQKHMLNYLWTYPVDHPLRTVLVSQMARQWENQYPNGIPQNLGLIFDMGQPDAMGNVKTLDLRQLNPFRTSFNMLTFTGWLGAMNPIALGLAQATGVNVLNAAPEMYPSMSFNTYYDLNTPTVPWQDRLWGMGSAIVPQVGGLQAFMGASAELKTLRQYDPQAYKNQVFSMLNMPGLFEGVQNQNVYQERAKVQQRMFQNLKSAVTTAENTGDFSGLVNFEGPYPWGGGWYTMQELQQQAGQAEQQYAQAGQPLGPLPPSTLVSTKKGYRI
jgi:hypothetical protein